MLEPEGTGGNRREIDFIIETLLEDERCCKYKFLVEMFADKKISKTGLLLRLDLKRLPIQVINSQIHRSR